MSSKPDNFPVQNLWNKIKEFMQRHRKALIISGSILGLYYGWGIIKLLLEFSFFLVLCFCGTVGGLIGFSRFYMHYRLKQLLLQLQQILKDDKIPESIAKCFGATRTYVLSHLPDDASKLKFYLGNSGGPISRNAVFFSFPMSYKNVVGMVTVVAPTVNRSFTIRRIIVATVDSNTERSSTCDVFNLDDDSTIIDVPFEKPVAQEAQVISEKKIPNK